MTVEAVCQSNVVRVCDKQSYICGATTHAEEPIKRGANTLAKRDDGSSPLRRVITLAETDARWEKIRDLMLKS